MEYQTIAARVVQGHRVASGLNGDTRFPGGTLRMQAPFFSKRGLAIGHLYLGTINISIAPWRYSVIKARHIFTNVKWHPTEPAEDFSFFNVDVPQPGQPAIAGFIYYPHPNTKPEHFQKPDVIELWLPFISGLDYGTELKIRVPKEQMIFETVPLPVKAVEGIGQNVHSQ